MNFKRKTSKKKGITLISLVVTIIILLILASISINMLTGENGIIKSANNAKEQAEIAEEKEIIQVAIVQARGNNKIGNLVFDELQEQLNKITGNEKTEVLDNGEKFEVVFVDKNRYYIVNKDGDIIEEGKIVIDKSPGDITKDENGNEIKEGQPYEIWCIEDLVEWSKNYQNYQNSNIILGRTLNFNSKYSYSNGKMLDCNSIEELKDLLTNPEGTGFTPIENFSNIFNGQGYEIQNIYINIAGNAGFFSTATGKIENLKISGNIKSTEGNAAGIIAGLFYETVSLEINNCENSAKVVSSTKAAGGIAGCGRGIKIRNCYNYGDIYSYGTDRAYNDYATGTAGGIVGTMVADIQDCGNEGYVSSTISAGGIIGYKYYDFNIINCYNNGEVKGTTYSGGIIGETKAGTGNIYNCYNIGSIYSDSNSGGIAGTIYYNTTVYIYNCYNMGIITGKKNIGGVIGKSNAGTGSYTQYMPIIQNTYSMPKTLNGIGNFSVSEVITEETNIENIVNSLNEYINNSEEGIDKSSWKRWKLAKSGYPIFE